MREKARNGETTGAVAFAEAVNSPTEHRQAPAVNLHHYETLTKVSAVIGIAGVLVGAIGAALASFATLMVALAITASVVLLNLVLRRFCGPTRE